MFDMKRIAQAFGLTIMLFCVVNAQADNQKVDEPKWSQSTCVRYVQFLQSLTFLEVTGEQRKCMFSKLEIHQTQ